MLARLFSELKNSLLLIIIWNKYDVIHEKRGKLQIDDINGGFYTNGGFFYIICVGQMFPKFAPDT